MCSSLPGPIPVREASLRNPPSKATKLACVSRYSEILGICSSTDEARAQRISAPQIAPKACARLSAAAGPRGGQGHQQPNYFGEAIPCCFANREDCIFPQRGAVRGLPKFTRRPLIAALVRNVRDAREPWIRSPDGAIQASQFRTSTRRLIDIVGQVGFLPTPAPRSS